MAISAYTKTTWADSPATSSQLNAANLQHIEDQVKDITDAALTVGTWTPTIIGSSTPGTQTYGTQVGVYVKIGKLVHVQGYVTITAKDAGIAGNIQVGGLPVATSSTSGSFAGFMIAQWGGITLTANYTQVAGYPGTNSTVVGLVQCGSAQAPAGIAVAGLAAASNIVISGTYIANS